MLYESFYFITSLSLLQNLSTGIVFCLAFNVLAVTICWIKGGGELYSLFSAEAHVAFLFIGVKI